MKEFRIGQTVRLESPQTSGRYIGWGRALYVRVHNDVRVSEIMSHEPPRCDLPLPTDEEVWAAYAAGGRLSKRVESLRANYLQSLGLGVL